MHLGLKGKHALITGGSHGIGLAIALELAQEGCHIAICSRDIQKLNKARDQIADHGVGVTTLPCDVLAPGDIEKTISSLNAFHFFPNILVNNVGGGGRWGKEAYEETDRKIWQEVYDKNTGAAIKFTMALVPNMQRQRWGRVVTIASIYGKEGGSRPWFNMAKAAEISLMKSLAMHPDYARSDITFNTVAPGNIMIPDTGWAKEAQENPEAFKRTTDALPLGRLGTPEEVAAVVTFLCSKQASLVNGACIVVDGGESKSF